MYVVRKSRSADFTALKLRKGQSGVCSSVDALTETNMHPLADKSRSRRPLSSFKLNLPPLSILFPLLHPPHEDKAARR